MPPSFRNPPEKFQVAFSIPGGQRDLVRAVAEAVERALGAPNVFFGEWFEHYLAGDGADLKLDQIYGERSALVVVCVAAGCEDPWTLVERNAVRARVMKARTSHEGCDALGVLPIRIGDGDVDGITFTTLVPDARTRDAEETARLILERLRLVLPAASVAPTGASAWPVEAPSLSWPMADHEQVRAAFAALLTPTAPHRCVFVRGTSGSGKTLITEQMHGHALAYLPDVACGRLDFKGTTDLDEPVRAFVQDLSVPEPPPGARLSERLGRILEALRQRGRPTLLVLDTYENAGQAQDWVEKQLLLTAIRAPWLRVVVAGQRVPAREGTAWERVTAPPLQLSPPRAADWLAYGRRHRSDLTESDLEAVVRAARENAYLLRKLLGPES